jgi:predicted dehydrogenase
MAESQLNRIWHLSRGQEQDRLSSNRESLPFAERRDACAPNHAAVRQTARSDAAATHSEKIGVAIVGCGWIAAFAHLPNIRRSRRFRLVAMADRSEERLAFLSRTFPQTYVTNKVEDVFRDRSVEAIIVAVPPQFHAEIAIAAFEAGKHVYLEKPIAPNLEDARRILRAWRKSGKIGMIGYNFRFSRVACAATERIRSGELGEILGVQGCFQWAAGKQAGGWRSEPGMGGDALLDLASHHIDLLGSLLPTRFDSVSATFAHKDAQDNCVSMTLATEDSCVCQLFASSAAGVNTNRIEFYGTRGSLRVDLLETQPSPIEVAPGRFARLYRARDRLSALNLRSLLRSPGYEPSFALALESFFSAISGGTRVNPDLNDAYKALVVCEAARRSAEDRIWPLQIERVAMDCDA